jgi:hypothetical protein
MDKICAVCCMDFDNRRNLLLIFYALPVGDGGSVGVSGGDGVSSFAVRR